MKMICIKVTKNDYKKLRQIGYPEKVIKKALSEFLEKHSFTSVKKVNNDVVLDKPRSEFAP